MTNYQTRNVLAGAYRGRDVAKRSLLTHLLFDDMTPEARTGCRIPADSLADCYSDEEGNDKRPTCPTCAKKWDRLHR